MITSGKGLFLLLLWMLVFPSGVLGESVELKVTRVALFSSGVAHLECEGTVAENATAELKFRTDQINDILKSLIVQDLDGGSISSVGYASQAPIHEVLQSFGVDLTGDPSLGQLLGQLRGEPIEITGPRAINGVIVGVEEYELYPEAVEDPPRVYLLNVLTDVGLQQMRLSDLQGIKLTNEKVNEELRKALTALAASHDAGKKGLVIRFDGKGRRRVRVSYLLESPIWKTSYRLVLGPGKKPFLQGWATAENATDEDWKDVRLSLVSGRPISFFMDLYTPLYVPRPEETLELYASLRAPEYEAGRTRGRMALGGMGGGGGYGGAPAQRPAGVRAAAALARALARAPLTGEATAEEDGKQDRDIALKGAGVMSAAKAQQAGELFEYAIRTPVSIARQHSAMLPIVNEEIGGQKLSIFNPATHPKYPLNGLYVENSTGLHLMQGPVTVFDGNVYAGDAKLPDLTAGEKRLIAYALDLGMEVTTEKKLQPEELVSLRIAKGLLWYRNKLVDERTYAVRNKDKTDRQVVIEQSCGIEWELVEPRQPFEKAGGLLRFKVAVPAGQTASQKVRVERVAEQSVALASTGLDAIQVYQRSRVISPATKEALERIVAMRTELDRVSRELAQVDKEATEAIQEQGRLRENLKVIERNTDTYQRQVKKFDELETRIEKLRGQVSEMHRDQEQKRSAMENYLISLKVE